jgi:hypothetical protein
MVQSSPKLLLSRELLHSQLLMKDNGGDKVYAKESIEARIKVISRLEEVLISALRLADPGVIEVSGTVADLLILKGSSSFTARLHLSVPWHIFHRRM